jgi:hypothetical protein
VVELESTYGVPTVGIYLRAFEPLVNATVRMNGMPTPRQAFIPGPLLNVAGPGLRAQIEGEDPVHHLPVMDVVSEALTRKLLPEERRGVGYERSLPRLLEPDTEENLMRRFVEEGWSDYLPIVLPTEDRVAAMLKGTSHAPDEVVGRLRPTIGGWEFREFDVEKVAVNAVMAGAAPEHLPVLLALASSGDHARNASATSMAKMVVVNGPVRHEIGMNAGVGALGPFNYANSVIGRAYGLLSQNLGGGSVPGLSYGGSQGNSLLYNNATFAENEEHSPFEPYHVRHGYRPDESTVTIFWAWGYWWAENLRTYWQEKLLAMLCGMEPTLGATFVVDPIVAHELVERGIRTPERLAAWVHEHARIPARRYWDHVSMTAVHSLVEAGVEPYASYRKAEPDALIPVFEPDRVELVVAGGSTNGSWFLFQGAPRRGSADPSRRSTVSIDAWR